MPVPLRATLRRARERMDALFRIVRPDSLYERPIPERHRIVFYIGHVEAFDWNLIGRGALELRSLHPEFDKLFAFGIDPPPGELPSDDAGDWPRVPEVQAYNARVRETLDQHLESVPEQLLHAAIEHRLMHVETFAYMLHNLPLERKLAVVEEAAPPGLPASPRMVDMPAGTAVLGRRPEEGFGWDNEFAAHQVTVPAFAIASHKVTNAEYLRFVEDGGPAPRFWARRGSGWLYRGMFAEILLPPGWPVYVSQEQATAYAAWAGKRLPTEAEYERAAAAANPPDPDRDNFNFRRWDPVPVRTDDSPGPSQMTGNGWEWTSSVFSPFPGFQPFSFYPGYSANFFDGTHYVLKGASPRTAAKLARRSFRNWFRAAYPYVYATFRLAER